MANAEFYDGSLLKSVPLSRSISRRSERQNLREVFLEGVKFATIYAQIERIGAAYCARCRLRYESVDVAMTHMHQHHRRQRSLGQGYRGYRDYGVDHPSNLELLCSECHQREHG